ncbi:RhoGAP domain-containing protein [Tieghemostelium lacteum]|uniref:RhoGAP domain-containing protein n=1 Tax=Tieghemostelium lacteum TaxID=361077 RepID=A0A151ZGR4_TIELA|nr:RhoGAP domain-containing protein [Tieghemostelium lacteum]|eukprot:KYQ93162.1 RhoGAP domain-containing protein [Tieghemostelium lacteum]
MQLKAITPYLEKLLEIFDKYHTNTESLYDQARNDFNINRLIRNIEQKQSFSLFIRDINNNIYSPHDIAWGIVEILKSTLEPLFPEQAYQSLIVCSLYEEEKIEKYKQCVFQIPEHHQTIMNQLFKIFVKISVDNSHQTNVTPTYIGETFATSLIRFKWRNDLDELGVLYHAPMIITTFIHHYHEIFSKIDKDYQDKQKFSQEKANEFMQYVLEKYLDYERHLENLYLEILKKEKFNHNDKKLIVETIRLSLSENPFQRKRERKKTIIGYFDSAGQPTEIKNLK